MAHPAAGIKRAADRGAGAGREARGRAAPPHPSHACEKNKARTPAGVCDTPHARLPGTAHRARPCVHVLDDRPETSPGRWRHQAVATKGRLGARSVGGRSAPRTPRAAAVPVAPIAFFVRLSLPRPRHSSGNSINSPRRCACSRMSPSAEVEAAAAAVSGVAAGVRERKAGLAAAERAGAGPLAGRARARGTMGAYTGMLLREGHTHTRARAGRSRRVTRRGCGGGGREKKGGGGRETCVRGASERLSSHSSISFFLSGPSHRCGRDECRDAARTLVRAQSKHPSGRLCAHSTGPPPRNWHAKPPPPNHALDRNDPRRRARPRAGPPWPARCPHRPAAHTSACASAGATRTWQPPPRFPSSVRPAPPTRVDPNSARRPAPAPDAGLRHRLCARHHRQPGPRL